MAPPWRAALAAHAAGVSAAARASELASRAPPRARRPTAAAALGRTRDGVHLRLRHALAEAALVRPRRGGSGVDSGTGSGGGGGRSGATWRKRRSSASSRGDDAARRRRG